MTRRDLLVAIGAFATGGVAGSAGALWRGAVPTKVEASVRNASTLDNKVVALSLAAFQRALREAGAASPLPSQLRTLHGLNDITGLLVVGAEDVVLFGTHQSTRPPIELDDLVIALRSAFQAGAEYRTPPGVTIDPDPAADDPWRLQIARVLGMPSDALMGERHTAIDYGLKKAAAGLEPLVPGAGEVGVFIRRGGETLCDRQSPGTTSATHRFWFYPKYAEDKPRFLRDGDTVLIRRAVGVQLLTEEEFLRHGERVGSAPARPDAEAFAREVTSVLAADSVPAYVRLRGDFRVIEVGKLLRFAGGEANAVSYLLHACPLSSVTPPGKLGGVRRREAGEVVCGVDVIQRTTSRGVTVSTKSDVRRYERDFRGGVEIAISIEAGDVGKANNKSLSDLKKLVLESRPSPEAVAWSVELTGPSSLDILRNS